MSFFQQLEGIRIGSISLSTILSALVVLAVCAIVISIINRIVKRALSRSRLEKSMHSFIGTAVKLCLWFIAVIIVASSVGIPVSSLVALLSIAGVALSLSIQGLLSNVFSGISVLSAKPFVAGDYVELGGVAGTVREVKLISTSILTIDNRVIYIPNSEVASSKLINYSREPLRRVDLLLCASYESPQEAVLEALNELMREESAVLSEPAPFASVMSFKDNSVEYVLRAWTKSEDYWDVFFRLNEAVRAKFAEKGVEMSYQHLNVHMIKEQ